MKAAYKSSLQASLIAALLLFIGCAEPLSVDQAQSSFGGGGGEPCCSVPDSPEPTLDPLAGEISEGMYKGTQAIEVDPASEMLILRLPFPGLALIPGFLAQAPIPGLPGAFVEVSPTLGADSGIALHLPLELIANYIDSRDSTRLPNGDALPAVPGGELPAFAVSIHPSPDVEVLVYIGPEAVAVLYWSSFDPFIRLSAPIYSEGQQYVLGWFHAIPHKRENFKVVYPRGGFMLSFSLPEDLQRQLDNLF